jgi:hypothetical protein
MFDTVAVNVTSVGEFSTILSLLKAKEVTVGTSLLSVKVIR